MIDGPVLLGAAPGDARGPIARCSAIGAEAGRRRRGGQARRRRRPAAALHPGRRGGADVQGARVRRHRDRLDGELAARGVRVLSPDDPPGAQLRARDRARHAARGVRRSPREAIAQRALEGLTPLDRQGGPPRRDRAADLRGARRRGPARVDAALLPLAEVGVRVGPGGADRHRRWRRSSASTGTSRWPARSRSSPARRAGSARRSPRCSRATARTSSGSTCPVRRASSTR